MPCDVRAARTMSSTRAAWKPRSANTRMPASSSRRIVLRPCARSSRACAGAPGLPAAPPVRRDDLYASLMLPATVAEAARRFGDRIAYVTEARLVAHLRRHRPHLRRGRRRPRPRGRRRRRRRRARAAARPRVSARLPRGRQARRDHRRRQRPALARASATAVLERRRPDARHRAHRDVEPTATTSIEVADADDRDVRARALRVARRRPAARRRPRPRRSRSSSRRARPGCPKGAVYGNRQLAFITQTDIGDTWDTGGRSFSGTSFAHLGFMTKLPGSLQRGGTTFIMERWRADDALELLAREQMTTVAGVPTQLALMLRHPDFDSFDLVERARSSSSAADRSRPGSPRRRAAASARALATRYSCTEAGIGLGTAFDDPDEDAVVSVGRPHAERRPRGARRRRPTRSPRARSARCACAPPR